MRLRVKRLLKNGEYLVTFKTASFGWAERWRIRKFRAPKVDLSADGLGTHPLSNIELCIRSRSAEEAERLMDRVKQGIQDTLTELSARKNNLIREKVSGVYGRRKKLVFGLACALALVVVSAVSGVISSERTGVQDEESTVPIAEGNLVSERGTSLQEGAGALAESLLADYQGECRDDFTTYIGARGRATERGSGSTMSGKPDFAITAVPEVLARYTEWGSGASGSESEGEYQNFKLVITSLGGFEGPVTLGVSGSSPLLDLRLYPAQIDKLPGSSTLLISFPPESVPQMCPDITIIARGRTSDGTLITHEKKLALAIRQKSSHQGPAWHVSPHGSDQSGDGGWGSPFRTIQRAIDCARVGDTVLVDRGLYKENISLYQKDGLVVASHFMCDPDESTVRSTIIEGKEEGWVVTIGRSEKVTLCGFTVQNGRGRNGSHGGGIYSFNSSPTIFNNVVTGNQNHSGHGAGIFCYESEPAILWNHITENSNYEGHGAGIYCYRSDPDIQHNVISGNYASGGGSAIHLLEPNSAKIVRNTIHGDSGSAVVVLYGSGVTGDFLVVNNTISGNRGDAVRFFGGPWYFENNIVTNNQGYGLFTLQGVGHLSYNDVWGNGRGDEALDYYGLSEDLIGNSGNISVDPRFGNPPHGNFHLCLGSPCIDTGDPNIPVPFAGGQRIDMGAFEYMHPDPISGDMNRDGFIDYGDINYLVKFLSGTVPSPNPLEIADVNCDEEIDLRDLGRLYRFLYYYGEKPCTDFKPKDRLTER
ncbi:MAG: right-handed parallel beta-helix repeat-containing protein [Candidatus Zixiibacteriota bacterium]